MHKCKKCGHKYYGNFCNNCGEPTPMEKRENPFICMDCRQYVTDDPSKECKGCGSKAWALKSVVEKPRRR